MNVDRDRFLEDGFLIVRQAIPPADLDTVRKAYETLVDKQREIWTRDRAPADPPGGVWETAAQPRLNLGSLAPEIDASTAGAVEAWLYPGIHGVSSELLGVPDAGITEMMLMCNPVRDHGPARWHRDMYPPYCAPLRGYIEDVLEGGPRYVQWNIALYDDDVLWVVPGSHIRVNTAEEDACIAADPTAEVPGAVQTHLKAGDGVVYILPILHWGSNYSPRHRRCIHGGFSQFSQYGDLGFLDALGASGQAAFKRWDDRSEAMKDFTERALRAILQGSRQAYFDALDLLHPGRGDKGRALSTVFLSKVARRIRHLKQDDFNQASDQEKGWAMRPHPMTLQWGSAFADRFSSQEADRLWERLLPVDALVRSTEPQYAPGFQGGESPYYFIDMPATQDVLSCI